MGEQLQLDIIIPVYNESENISKVFEHFKKSIKSQYRILICYDFEEDNTLPIVKNYQQNSEFNIQLIKNHKKGPLSAIVAGFAASSAPFVLVYPADDFVNAKIIDQMLDLAKNGADLVCPSRFMNGGKMENAPWLKASLQIIGNLFLYHVAKVGTKDASNGFRLFSRKLLQNIKIESTKGFTYSIELLVKAHRLGYNIKELPSHWIERINGQSRFKVIAWLPSYLKWLCFALLTRLGAKHVMVNS